MSTGLRTVTSKPGKTRDRNVKAIPAMSLVTAFALPAIPAGIAGAALDSLGVPLGWLLGAALVSGALAMSGRRLEVPKALYAGSLAVVGASVGLSISPATAAEIMSWAPVMILAGLAGILLATLLTPILARFGRVTPATAFFSLLPGGVIEMANIGDRYGANRIVIAALHTLRVGLVVTVLPLGLFAAVPLIADAAPAVSAMPIESLAAVLAIATIGGFLASKVRFPAAWLLGAVILVGAFTASGIVGGVLPGVLVAVAQIVIGMSLGSKFKTGNPVRPAACRLLWFPRAICHPDRDGHSGQPERVVHS